MIKIVDMFFSCYSMIGKYGGRQGVSIGEGCERVRFLRKHLKGIFDRLHHADDGISFVNFEILKSPIEFFI